MFRVLFFLDNENLIFRGNTFATKAVDTYMKMVGEAVRKREREGGEGERERRDEENFIEKMKK